MDKTQTDTLAAECREDQEQAPKDLPGEDESRKVSVSETVLATAPEDTADDGSALADASDTETHEGSAAAEDTTSTRETVQTEVIQEDTDGFMDLLAQEAAKQSAENDDAQEAAKESAENDEPWNSALGVASEKLFERLTIPEANKPVAAVLLKRIQAGAQADDQTRLDPNSRECFKVQHVKPKDSKSRSHIQVDIGASRSRTRTLAQMAILATYQTLDKQQVKVTSIENRWRVQQTCQHHDGTWYCFEPSHLKKVSYQSKTPSSNQVSIPGGPENAHASYEARATRATSAKLSGPVGGAVADV